MAPPATRLSEDERWLLPVAVLAFCHAQAIASFQILNILVDPIKASLSISDTQYSLLQGLAVAVFAAALGLPAARQADRGSRRNVVLVGAIGWSLATASAAFATNFSQLFVARVATGIGEVFLFPAALSLIAAIAPARQLSRAIAIFSIGGPLGTAAALFGGGWIVVHSDAVARLLPLFVGYEPWRIAFALCGASGFVTVIMLLAVREPRRSTGGGRHSNPGQIVAYVAQRWRLFVPVSGGMLLLAMCSFATAAWAPTVLVRSYGLTHADAGALTGAAALVGGTVFVWLAGQLADSLHGRGIPAGVIWLSAGLATALLGIGGLAHFGARDISIAAWLCIFALLGVSTVLAATAIQMITPGGMRAQVMALHLLLMNALALSSGPLAVAVIAQDVLGREDAVDTSLVIVNSLAAGGALLLFLAVRNRFAAGTKISVSRSR